MSIQYGAALLLVLVIVVVLGKAAGIARSIWLTVTQRAKEEDKVTPQASPRPVDSPLLQFIPGAPLSLQAESSFPAPAPPGEIPGGPPSPPENATDTSR